MIVTSNTTLTVKVLNPRVLKAFPVQKECEQVVNDEIVSLNFQEIQIKKGDVIKVGKQKYKIKSIIKDLKGLEGPGYYLYTHNGLTKSTTFLMPFLGGNHNNYRYKLNFVNAFLDAELDPNNKMGESLYLLYRFDGSLNYLSFDEDIRNHPYFEEGFEPDPYHTLYKFKLPENFKEDIELILKGKYSKISTEAKQLILNFHLSHKNRPLGQILLRSPERRKQMEEDLGHPIPKENELLSPINFRDEIYTNEFIIN